MVSPASHGGKERQEAERRRLTTAPSLCLSLSPGSLACGENVAVLLNCCWETDVNTQKEIRPVSCHTIKTGNLRLNPPVSVAL